LEPWGQVKCLRISCRTKNGTIAKIEGTEGGGVTEKLKEKETTAPVSKTLWCCLRQGCNTRKRKLRTVGGTEAAGEGDQNAA